MTDIVVGILALGAGLLLCLSGYWTLRLLLSIWGGVIGFGLGSGLATWINDDSYLATALGWIVGLVLALIFAALAYLYYVVAVVLSFASIGFTLGATVLAAIGVSWNWVLVTVGVVCGLLLALLAIATDLPLVILVVLSSIAGAGVVVTGLMLLTNVIDTADFDEAALTDHIDGRWWWSVAFVVVAAVGMFTQLRRAREFAGIRQAWIQASAGRPNP